MKKHWKKMGKAACKAGWLLSDVPYADILRSSPIGETPYQAGRFAAAWRKGYLKALRRGQFNVWSTN